MVVRKLDSNGDISTSGTQFITDKEEVAQTIKTRLKLFYGEYFRDITDGTLTFQIILNKKATVSARDSVIKNRIVETLGVLAITNYTTNYDINLRTYSVDCTVLTIYGDINVILNESI